jgi:mono/diheme cytochrome c family protein
MRFTPIATLMIALAAAGCSETTAAHSATAPSADTTATVARGKYLVTVMGCSDCHTPLKMGPRGPSPDLDRALSGHPEQMGALRKPPLDQPYLWAGAATNTAFAGPWGISYAANLTPDQNTGLGIWTEQMFVTALRTGKHMATSRPILPPMPWQAAGQATDEDLKAIYAYLRTLKPITNHVPEAQLAGEE